jgi:CHAD domain-containing protein
MKLKLKAEKFSKKKELEFPTLKKNFIVERSKIESRTRKSLNKVVDKIQSRRNDNTAGTHEIRIAFKKFRYNVEVLSYIEKTDEEKLEKLKYFQDKLGEIQDYEVLITGITNYFSTKDPTKITSTELFKQEQNKLIETFDNETVTLLEVCKDMIAIIQNQKSN